MLRNNRVRSCDVNNVNSIDWCGFIRSWIWGRKRIHNDNLVTDDDMFVVVCSPQVTCTMVSESYHFWWIHTLVCLSVTGHHDRCSIRPTHPHLYQWWPCRPYTLVCLSQDIMIDALYGPHIPTCISDDHASHLPLEPLQLHLEFTDACLVVAGIKTGCLGRAGPGQSRGMDTRVIRTVWLIASALCLHCHTEWLTPATGDNVIF